MTAKSRNVGYLRSRALAEARMGAYESRADVRPKFVPQGLIELRAIDGSAVARLPRLAPEPFLYYMGTDRYYDRVDEGLTFSDPPMGIVYVERDPRAHDQIVATLQAASSPDPLDKARAECGLPLAHTDEWTGLCA